MKSSRKHSKQTPSSPQTPVIAITMGDPGGIGSEILIKAINEEKPSSKIAYLVIGTQRVFEWLKQKTDLKANLKTVSVSDVTSLEGGESYFLDIAPGFFDKRVFRPATLCKENGRLALLAIEQAAELANQKKIRAIVTAPINKTAMRLVDKNFIGHTEFFAKKAKAKKYAMMFLSSKLNVILATMHAPIKKVSGLLSETLVLEKILMAENALRVGLGIAEPKIGVCALNPHGRECGKEEDKIIKPAIRKAQKKGVNATGPIAADLAFYAAYNGRYDALVSMYHDQALAPFKLVAFEDGVNVTLGLPYTRTSPDHGTAFDIAYSGKANPSSMIAALKFAKRSVLEQCFRK